MKYADFTWWFLFVVIVWGFNSKRTKKWVSFWIFFGACKKLRRKIRAKNLSILSLHTKWRDNSLKMISWFGLIFQGVQLYWLRTFSHWKRNINVKLYLISSYNPKPITRKIMVKHSMTFATLQIWLWYKFFCCTKVF